MNNYENNYYLNTFIPMNIYIMASITNNEEFFTRRQVRGLLFDKSDKVNTYTKAQDNELLSEKQPLLGIDDLTISMTNGLLDAIDSTQCFYLRKIV